MKLKETTEQELETYLINIGLKPVTYKKNLLYFRHFKEMYGDFITQKAIDSFLQQKTTPTHRAMIRHLISLLKRDITLTQEEQIELNLLGLLKMVGKRDTRKIPTLTKIEIQKILNECKLPSPFQTERFKLMVSFQYTSGLRINELCSLRFEHLNYQGRNKFFEDGRDKLKYQKCVITPDIAKGSKGDNFYVRTDIYLAFFDFLKRWEKINPSVVSRIVNNQRPLWAKNKTKYSKDFKEQVFQVLGYKLPDGKSTHILRHSICTHLLEEGILSINEVKDFMRHSNISITDRYIHLAKDSLSKGLEKM